MDKYKVSFEIAGPAAMFSRPDTGSAPVSYPCPTYCAAKGMFESVVRVKSAFIRPTKIEICAPVKYHKYGTNYGGPLRKSNQLAKGASYQLPAIILFDVCYKIYGLVESIEEPDPILVKTTNHLHLLKDKFEKRLRNGRVFHVPCLGWKEFVPEYFGPLRSKTETNKSINEYIPSMLFSRFDQPRDGSPTAIFKQDVWIREGVLDYAQ